MVELGVCWKGFQTNLTDQEEVRMNNFYYIFALGPSAMSAVQSWSPQANMWIIQKCAFGNVLYFTHWAPQTSYRSNSLMMIKTFQIKSWNPNSHRKPPALREAVLIIIFSSVKRGQIEQQRDKCHADWPSGPFFPFKDLCSEWSPLPVMPLNLIPTAACSEQPVWTLPLGNVSFQVL